MSGHRIPDAFLQDIADAYVSGKPATEIANEHGVAVATVRSWVHKARRRGLLAPPMSAKARQDALVAEVERLRVMEAAVTAFVAARAEYITSILNCHPDNARDYHRWQGHAESRRQLAETLGLPVAWPTKEASS